LVVLERALDVPTSGVADDEQLEELHLSLLVY